MSWSSLKRYTPVRKRRATPRRGEPTPADKQAARELCYNRAGGHCELRNGSHCLGYAPLNAGEGDEHQGQLAHLKAKRRFGWQESEATGQRHLWSCWRCHQYEHQHGKQPPINPHQ